jgi:hypothetical protein
MSGKELYENLAVLREHCAGTLAEASLDYVVDQLVRTAVSERARTDTVQGVTKYQNVYQPIHDPEEGK